MIKIERNASYSSILFIFFRLLCFIICGVFLFTDLRVAYLSFCTNGLMGLIIGVLNTLFIHVLFMQFYSLLITGKTFFKLPKQTFSIILLSGMLFSCNAIYAAILYKIKFLTDMHFMIYYIFVIPPIFNFFLIFWYKKIKYKESDWVRNLIVSNKLLVLGFVFEFIFFSMHIITLQFTYVNNIFIFLIFGLQLYVNHQKLADLAEHTIKIETEHTIKIKLKIDNL